MSDDFKEKSENLISDRAQETSEPSDRTSGETGKFSDRAPGLAEHARRAMNHTRFFFKWIALAVLVGLVCGLVGSALHFAVDSATERFNADGRLLFLLPAAGLLIVFCYRGLNIYNDEGTNSILRAARGESESALRMTPLIFIATFLTHLCGGSAGREGAALQIGGSLGSFMARKFHFTKEDSQLMVMCGMSATFCALFGTPMTAAFFSIEVAGVGTVFYAGLVPSVLASFIALEVSKAMGAEIMQFEAAPAQDIDMLLFGRILILAALTGILAIIFCSVMHNTGFYLKKYIKNPYIRVFAGGTAVVLITLILGTGDYNGAGMDTIALALSGQARPEAFALKIILTALTLGAGYKGGEIIPTLFIGSTFGCTVGMLLGLDPVFAAEAGLIGLFCGVVNCPVSSILMSVELFGGDNFFLFGITAAVSYLLSGYYSLYSGQKFMNSKIIPRPFERDAD